MAVMTIKSGNSDNQVIVNDSGALLTSVVPSVLPSETVVVQFNEVNSIAVGTETSVLTYTAPIGKNTYVLDILASGQNRGYFNVYNNGTLVDKQYLTVTDLTGEFDYKSNSTSVPGMPVSEGTIVEIKVVNAGEDAVAYNARFLILTVG